MANLTYQILPSVNMMEKTVLQLQVQQQNPLRVPRAQTGPWSKMGFVIKKPTYPSVCMMGVIV